MTKQTQIHCQLCNQLYTPKDKYQDLCNNCTPVKRDYEVEAIGKELRYIATNRTGSVLRFSEVW